MKRIIIISLALVFMLAAFACGGEDRSQKTENTKPEPKGIVDRWILTKISENGETKDALLFYGERAELNVAEGGKATATSRDGDFDYTYTIKDNEITMNSERDSLHGRFDPAADTLSLDVGDGEMIFERRSSLGYVDATEDRVLGVWKCVRGIYQGVDIPLERWHIDAELTVKEDGSATAKNCDGDQCRLDSYTWEIRNGDLIVDNDYDLLFRTDGTYLICESAVWLGIGNWLRLYFEKQN